MSRKLVSRFAIVSVMVGAMYLTPLAADGGHGGGGGGGHQSCGSVCIENYALCLHHCKNQGGLAGILCTLQCSVGNILCGTLCSLLG